MKIRLWLNETGEMSDPQICLQKKGYAGWLRRMGENFVERELTQRRKGGQEQQE